MKMMILLITDDVDLDRVGAPKDVDDDDFFNIPSQRAPGSCSV